jgi:hypothetical protein
MIGRETKFFESARFIRGALILLLSASPFVSSAAAPGPAPAFVGWARLSSVHRGIAQMTATLDVEIQGSSTSVLTNPSATVKFQPGWLHGAVYLAPLPPPQASEAVFRAPISFTLNQYASWRNGAFPVARFSYTDSAGNTVSADVPLRITPVQSGVPR